MFFKVSYNGRASHYVYHSPFRTGNSQSEIGGVKKGLLYLNTYLLAGTSGGSLERWGHEGRLNSHQVGGLKELPGVQGPNDSQERQQLIILIFRIE